MASRQTRATDLWSLLPSLRRHHVVVTDIIDTFDFAQGKTFHGVDLSTYSAEGLYHKLGWQVVERAITSAGKRR